MVIVAAAIFASTNTVVRFGEHAERVARLQAIVVLPTPHLGPHTTIFVCFQPRKPKIERCVNRSGECTKDRALGAARPARCIEEGDSLRAVSSRSDGLRVLGAHWCIICAQSL